MTKQLPKQHTTTGEGPSIPALGGHQCTVRRPFTQQDPKRTNFIEKCFMSAKFFFVFLRHQRFFFGFLCVAQGREIVECTSLPRPVYL